MTWLFELLKAMSPTIVEAFKEGLGKLLDDLALAAEKTENKWDDWGVAMIRKILKVDD